MNLPRTVTSTAFAAATVVFVGLLPVVVSGPSPSLQDHLYYAFGLVFFFYIPGIAVLRWLDLRLHGVELALIGLALGIAVSNTIYVAAAWLGFPSLYLVWPALALIARVTDGFRTGDVRSSKRVALVPNAAVWFIALICVLPLAMLPHFTGDFVALENGAIQYSMHRDGLLHVSVTNELAHTFPPQAPFLAGHLLTYHYGMELSAVVFHRFLGIAAADVCLRLLPSLYLALIVFAVYSFSRRWLASVPIALVTALLVLLGEDFSYIPGMLQGGGGVWIADYFWVPSIFALYFANPLPPAVAFLYSGLMCLSRGLSDVRRQRSWLLVAALMFAVMGTFKVFLIMQLMVALAAVAVLRIRRDRGYFTRAFLATSAACIIVLVPMLAAHHRTTVIEFVPVLFGNLIPGAMQRLQLSELPVFRAVEEMFSRGHLSISGVMATLFVALPLFILGSFGIRVVGIPGMLKSLRSWRSGSPIRFLLASFVISGCAASIFLRITPVDYPRTYDNSVWFFAQSKLVAWVFVGEALRRLLRTRSRRLAAVGISVLILVALPGAINLFAVNSNPGTLRTAPSDAADVVRFLSREAHRGSIILAEDRKVSICLLAEAPVRVPYLEIFVVSFLPKAEILSYRREFRFFWSEWRAGRFRARVTEKRDVDFVVATSPLEGATASFSNGTYYVYPVAALRPLTAGPRNQAGRRISR